jgi:hypothetical protein
MGFLKVTQSPRRQLIRHHVVYVLDFGIKLFVESALSLSFVHFVPTSVLLERCQQFFVVSEGHVSAQSQLILLKAQHLHDTSTVSNLLIDVDRELVFNLPI